MEFRYCMILQNENRRFLVSSSFQKYDVIQAIPTLNGAIDLNNEKLMQNGDKE